MVGGSEPLLSTGLVFILMPSPYTAEHTQISHLSASAQSTVGTWLLHLVVGPKTHEPHSRLRTAALRTQLGTGIKLTWLESCVWQDRALVREKQLGVMQPHHLPA